MAVFLQRAMALTLVAAVAGLSALVVAPEPAAAQFSNTYLFLKGVRDRDFSAVQEIVEQPGSTLINVRDRGTGEGALHIVTKRRDTQFLLYLLNRGANPDIRDNDGNTPMHIASQMGYPDAVRWLTAVNGNVNAANNRGETPLILAVQQHNAEVVRQLVDSGADPNIADSIVGMSARDYAQRDPRGRVLVQLLDRAQTTESEGETIGPSLD